MNNDQILFVLANKFNIDEQIPFYNQNRRKLIDDVNGTLGRIDSDISQKYITKVVDKEGMLKPYGEHVLYLQYAINLLDWYFRDSKNRETIAKLKDTGIIRIVYFCYQVYWHCGNDFLLGNIIENKLHLIENLDGFRKLAEVSNEEKNGNFREDLYYRVMGLPIELPPLRERGNDVLILAKHFAKEFATINKLGTISFTEGAINKLLQYNFPGNIRELKSVVDLAVVLSENNEIKPNDITFNSIKEQVDLPACH